MDSVIEILKKDVEKAFNASLEAKNRKREVVNARIAFSWICRKFLKLNYSFIGRTIQKDHATIIHYTKNFEGIYKTDLCFRIMYNKLNVEDYLIIEDDKIIFEIERLELKINHLKNRLSNAV